MSLVLYYERTMCIGKQNKMDLFILERRRQRRAHISVLSCLMESYREDGSGKLSEMHSKRIRSNGSNLLLGKIQSKIKSNLYTICVKALGAVPRKAAESLSSYRLRIGLNKALSKFWSGPSLTCRYWRRWHPEGPSKLYFMTLWFPTIAVSLTAWYTPQEKSWHDTGSAYKQLH